MEIANRGGEVVIEILIVLFFKCGVIVIAFSIPIVIACLLSASTDDDPEYDENHYYGDRPGVGHDDRRQGLRTDDEQDAGTDAFDHSWLP